MTADPKKSLTSASISDLAKSDVDRLLQTGLADFSIRELLGLLISPLPARPNAMCIWRKVLPINPTGFYDRSLQVGSIPTDIRVPRTRSGAFRPASLPSRYRRGYSEEVESLLIGLLASPAAPSMPPKMR